MRTRLIAWSVSFLAVASHAATVREEFNSDPTANGWQAFGDASLFAWDETNQALRVTWDSSRANSYYLLPLGTIVTREDDFQFAFDLWLDDIAIGTTGGKADTFQLAVGLIRRASATSTNFLRGAGMNSVNGPRNLIEFDYFPDSGFGATISPTIISTNNQFATSFSYPITLDPEHWFHIQMTFTASNGVLRTQMTRDGVVFGPIANTTLKETFTDFRVDAFAVCSYNDEGQYPPEFAGSLLAHGQIDNVSLTVPDSPVMNMTLTQTNALPQITFVSRSNWVYGLQRSASMSNWDDVSEASAGTGAALTLTDTNPPTDHAFYRIRAYKP